MTEARIHPDQALVLLALTENTILSTGPHGESPTPAAEIELTYNERRRLRGLGATAAVVMHIESEKTKAEVDGLTATLTELGIKVIASTNGEGRTEKQVADIEAVLFQKPSVVVSIPWSARDEAAAYRKIVDSGAKLVFIEDVPDGFVAGRDYVSVVAADNFGNGVVSAHLMAQALDGKGTIGMIEHQADFFVTRQRADAFEVTIAENYPGLRIVGRQGVSGPDFAADGEAAGAALLAAQPDLAAIWAVWDAPARGAMTAARAAGRTDLVVTTFDLGLNVAVELATDGMIKGVGAQRPYAAGVTEALLAGYAILGKSAPPFVALPALPVTRGNVLAAWDEVYGQPPPESLSRASSSPGGDRHP